MGRLLRLLMLLLVASATLTYAAEVRPGDQVRFIERDQHIPAHPAPGDTRLHLRFVSGSSATVLQVNAATGWIEVRGEPLQGTGHTGWITPRYLAGQPNGTEPTPDPLAWCPPKGSPAPHPSGRLRLATWNLENLHAQDGQSTYTGSDPSVARVAVDYDRIRCHVRLFDPDILAVQEVDGEEALSRVVDTDVYEVHVDDRPKGALNGQQNTGFAYKRGLTAVRQPDFEALDVRGDGTLRYGARIDLTHNGQTLQLLSVHLKSGCFDNATTSSACATLLAQVPVLEGWIDTAAEGPTPFIVLGDFNRRFNVPNDQVWAELHDGEPANADLTTVRQDMPISTEEELGLPPVFLTSRPGCDFDRTPTGCGNVWSSAAIDARRRLVFFASSNCDTDDDPATLRPPPPMPPYDEAIVALHFDGTPAWRWRPREVDHENLAFGAAPNLFTITLGNHSHDVVGVGNKDGTYYVLDREGVNGLTGVRWDDRNPSALPYWATRVVPGEEIGGIIATAAVDQAAGRIYFSTAPGFDPFTPQRPSVHALDRETGTVLWQNTREANADASFAPTSAIPGVVFIGSLLDGVLRAYDAATGEQLASIRVGFSLASAPAIVDGMVLIGAGIGERTGDPTDPAEITSRIPQNVTALCVPGTPHCQ